MAGAQMHMALAPQYGLTPRERDCLAAIGDYVSRTGAAPAYSDLGALLGLSSKSGVYRLVDGLEQRGWIRKLPNKARSIEIVSRVGASDGVTIDVEKMLPRRMLDALRAHCTRTGEQLTDVIHDAVALFLDQIGADPE